MTDVMVSCIMPTYNRREFIPRALAYFERQDYPHRELIVLDDGSDCIQDLIPSSPNICYVRLPARLSLGRKRNLACEQARGSLIAHWDDDDWYSSSRLRECVRALADPKVSICGVSAPYFLDPGKRQLWQFHYNNGPTLWVAGSSLCYRRDYWASHRFSEINIGEDTHFIQNARPGDAVSLPDSNTFVALIHPQNTSSKHAQGPNWIACPFEGLRQVMGDDLAFYGLAPRPTAASSSSGPMIVARAQDLTLPEYAAFNHGAALPWMRRWELPFALFQSRLTNTASVLDSTINPYGFSEWLAKLYPHALYRHMNPLAQGVFTPPLGVPDESFDRAICVNTLEHLVAEQRAKLIEALARKLKPGGLLTLASDSYFDSSWRDPAFLNAGVMRRDRSEFLNGWNNVKPEEYVGLCQSHGLSLLTGEPGVGGPAEDDAALYTQQAPFRHACIAGVFQKGAVADLPCKKIVLALLTWNTRDISTDSVRAYVREAQMLARLGHQAFLCVVDNGSSDGTPDQLRLMESEIEVPHKFVLNRENLGNSVARNQILDYMRECDADYVLFMDGDIEIVPFSSFAMLRYMENCGRELGCIGADSLGQTANRAAASPYLFSIAGLKLQTVNLVAWTQYGMFRREVFEDGIRFDEAAPFRGPGWGFEDNDLAFQMDVKGYVNQRFHGMVYLHRAMCSSIRIMRGMGIDAGALYQRRKQYTISKWSTVPRIATGPLMDVRRVEMRA